MAISKEKKVEVIATIEAGLKEAETVTFVNFHGLTVKEVTELRRDLRAQGVKYYVAKKTLVKRALDAQKVSGTQPELTGELALAWSSDAVASAKGVFEFQKTHKEKVKLLGGVYQGAYMSQAEITTLAAIPGMDGLRGQFLSLLQNSIAGVVRVIDAKATAMGSSVSAAVTAVAETVAEVATEAAAPEAPAAEAVPVAA
jgi:large subunit ribosomal protein L10